MTEDSPNYRVYLIRLACGDGKRTAMPMAEFAALLTARGRTRYDSSTISKIENESRSVSLEDVANIAAVDPLQRGKPWLAWGDEAAVPARQVKVTRIPLPPARTVAVETNKKAAPDKGGQRGKRTGS